MTAVHPPVTLSGSVAAPMAANCGNCEAAVEPDGPSKSGRINPSPFLGVHAPAAASGSSGTRWLIGLASGTPLLGSVWVTGVRTSRFGMLLFRLPRGSRMRLFAARRKSVLLPWYQRIPSACQKYKLRAGTHGVAGSMAFWRFVPSGKPSAWRVDRGYGVAA